MNDTWTALPSDRIDEFLNHLNSLKSSMQFTVKATKMMCWYYLAKRRKGEDTPVASVGQKKGKGTVATQFLLAMADMQEGLQERQTQHDAKMQEEAMKFQLKLEADISAKLQ